MKNKNRARGELKVEGSFDFLFMMWHFEDFLNSEKETNGGGIQKKKAWSKESVLSTHK